jgi:hypothetical protein
MQQNENPWTPGQIRLLGVILVLVITCFLEITVKEVSAQGSTDHVDYGNVSHPSLPPETHSET